MKLQAQLQTQKEQILEIAAQHGALKIVLAFHPPEIRPHTEFAVS